MDGRKKPDWLVSSVYAPLFGDVAEIRTLQPNVIEKGTILFRPGDPPSGFVLVLSGRVGVFLIGKAGREMLLYSVEPGETCVQTTMGLLADQAYSGEAVAETDCAIVVIPQVLFARLMDESAVFRSFVFTAFGSRLADVTRMLELVAFTTIETRLARLLLERGRNDKLVEVTHQELATAIGSSREVVSRRLEVMQRNGLVELDRGTIRIVKPAGLVRLAE